MRRVFALLPLILSLAACQTLARFRDAGYPALFVNGRPFDSAVLKLTTFSACPEELGKGTLISSAVLRFAPPVHGPARPGGCVYINSLQVRLTDVEMDNVGALRLRGTVGAVHTGSATSAEIRVTREGNVVQRVFFDGKEPFELVAEPHESAILMFSALGFHTLMVDLKGLVRVARRVERFDPARSPSEDGER